MLSNSCFIFLFIPFSITNAPYSVCLMKRNMKHELLNIGSSKEGAFVIEKGMKRNMKHELLNIGSSREGEGMGNSCFIFLFIPFSITNAPYSVCLMYIRGICNRKGNEK